ncbi:acetate uptake transporter family protein [Nocardioides terrisoli]|uniref:hypothetical protein n=1 Tax=Nocardioides terrisoli TaxID=3388267 RepID=UPI00287B962E|nr:hypothetical protein [Nocardioides marmorisolisilvae]
MTQSDLRALPVPDSRIFLRPLANPIPLGFLALVTATTVYAAMQLGWISPAQGRLAAEVVLVLCVPLQLVAMVLGFLCRDPVAGTGMGMLAAGWGTIALGTLTTGLPFPAPVLAVVLFTVAACLLVPCVAGWGKPVAALVMLVSAARFVVTAVAGLASSSGWSSALTWAHVAGWVGIALAVIALYAALAFELESIAKRAVLPVPRLGPARIDDEHVGLSQQHAALVREAGVRRQL